MPEMNINVNHNSVDLSVKQMGESQQNSITELQFNQFLVNTKLKGNKINIKQHKQKLGLKNTHNHKTSLKKTQKTFKGQLGLLQSLAWEEQFNPIDEIQRQQWLAQQRNISTSQRRRTRMETQRKIIKTAEQNPRSKNREEKKLQNLLTTIVPAKTNSRKVSYFISENLEPRGNKLMNLAIRNTIHVSDPAPKDKAQMTLDQISEQPYLSEHKKLRSKIKSRSLNVRLREKKVQQTEIKDKRQFKFKLEGPSPLIDRLIYKQDLGKKVQKKEKDGLCYLSLYQ